MVLYIPIISITDCTYDATVFMTDCGIAQLTPQQHDRIGNILKIAEMLNNFLLAFNSVSDCPAHIVRCQKCCLKTVEKVFAIKAYINFNNLKCKKSFLN